MKKIPTLFIRDFANNPARVTREVNPECAWVLAGEGVATRKHDGIAILVKGDQVFKRYTMRTGQIEPEGFVAAQAPDPITGDCPGWLIVDPMHPSNRWIVEALTAIRHDVPDGTYELVGPKINGNAEGLAAHTLIPHGDEVLSDAPRDFDGLLRYLATHPMEGIVFHRGDGSMAKIKAKDMGIRWPR